MKKLVVLFLIITITFTVSVYGAEFIKTTAGPINGTELEVDEEVFYEATILDSEEWLCSYLRCKFEGVKVNDKNFIYSNIEGTRFFLKLYLDNDSDDYLDLIYFEGEYFIYSDMGFPKKVSIEGSTIITDVEIKLTSIQNELLQQFINML